MSASAVNDDGLTVEKLSFRDVLRLYTLDKDSFGTDALETDAGGVTNAAKRLAELFTYTVGLNYDGKGANANFFGKDITALMGTEPYADGNLLATYDVEIAPYRSYAVALPQGQTESIRVYLAGYTNAANGVEHVLHYVWQDQGLWYAVKDDNPYYRVSYNGNSAKQLSGSGLSITYTRSAAGGTQTLQSWQDLTEAPDGDGVVHLDCSTLVVGQGTANVFGLTRDLSRLQTEGNYSASLLAVSDFVRGDSSYQTGPLVYSRSVYEADNMHRVADGESLKEGVSYRFRVVYDEPLAVAPEAEWSSVGMSIRSETNGSTVPVSDFTWYGSEAYLTTNQYNPHAVEFSFTPSTQGYGVCTFVPENLVGSESALKAAEFHACTETGSPVTVPTVTPAPTAPPVQTPVSVPVQLAAGEPEAVPTQAPIQETVPMAAAETAPVAAAPAAETVTPQPAAATPAVPMTPSATLDILFSANETSPLTRGVLAETLWILAGQPLGDNSIVFADQITDANMGQAILWASRTGLIPGGTAYFGINEVVTREQAAAVLCRYAAMRGKDLSTQSDLSAWTDGAAVSADNAAGVIWALERGLMNGFGDGYLRPAQAATCGEAIEMIRTMQQKL
jgi:hypothetical protein